MKTLEVRPIMADLKDQVEICQHRWPVEGSECPFCMKEALPVEKTGARFVDLPACMCNGPFEIKKGQALVLCGVCSGIRPFKAE
jgi:DNA-binding helix-hairpin-helix protein with protein kinase domain